MRVCSYRGSPQEVVSFEDDTATNADIYAREIDSICIGLCRHGSITPGGVGTSRTQTERWKRKTFEVV